MIQNFGKIFTVACLGVALAVPMPAAEPSAEPIVNNTSNAKSKSSVRARHAAARYRGVPTYADSVRDDDPTFDDPLVRQAVVEGLGRYNGSVVAVDPNTGRILTIVNQKIAFSDGYIPCSTIKPTIAIAALEENVITSDTMLKVGRRKYAVPYVLNSRGPSLRGVVCANRNGPRS